MPDMCALWMGGGGLMTHCCFIFWRDEILAYRTWVVRSEYMSRRVFYSILYCIRVGR